MVASKILKDFYDKRLSIKEISVKYDVVPELVFNIIEHEGRKFLNDKKE